MASPKTKKTSETPRALCQFRADGLVCKEDATVVLRAGADADPNEGVDAADLLRDDLRQPPEDADPDAPPQYSLAKEFVFAHGAAGGVYRARGLACLCERGRAVSVTLRAAEKHARGTRAVEPDPIPAATTDRKPWKFKPPAKPGEFWFSVEEQCRALDQLILRSASGHLHGLVVVCGATNSAKSLVARGLTHLHLERKVADYHAAVERHRPDRRKYDTELAQYPALKQAYDDDPKGDEPKPPEFPEWKARRPHLVTFEDPIEKFFFEPTGGRLAAEVAQDHGLDYTPREKGRDVGTLVDGFRDALRQTPAVYYIGEVRDRRDWREVLEFAGTGHLVVTTAHAGSLLEMVMKILSAVKATTAARRRLYAEKLLAVVHMRPFNQVPTADSPSLLLPSVWRNREKGLAALTATGFSSVMPVESVPLDEAGAPRDDESCFGYHAMFQRLADLRAADAAAPAPALPPDTRTALAELAREHDL